MKSNCLEVALVSVLLLVFAAPPLLAQTPWIHVEVDEEGDNASRVKVNLPLSVVEIALEAAPEKILDEGRIHLRHVDEDIDIATLRRMWTELRAAGDTELVSVEERDETVSIRREGDHVLIDVDDHEDGDNVHVRVPVSVVDALLSAEGNELNLKDALSELKRLRGDIVRVDDGATKVRVWIDAKDGD